MDGTTDGLIFEGEIESYLRSECIGFQRDGDRLIPVVQMLVQPRRGPLTTLYQVQTGDDQGRQLRRFRPPVDIPAPQRRPLWSDD